MGMGMGMGMGIGHGIGIGKCNLARNRARKRRPLAQERARKVSTAPQKTMIFDTKLEMSTKIDAKSKMFDTKSKMSKHSTQNPKDSTRNPRCSTRNPKCQKIDENSKFEMSRYDKIYIQYPISNMEIYL